MANIPYADYGVPSVQTDSFTQVELFAGDTPLVVTDYGVTSGALASSGIPAWTPVFVDPRTREVSLAVFDDAEEGSPVAPNAITIVTIQPGSAPTRVPVYKAGSFNIRALNWPASFDTEDKKFSAFAGNPDNQIYIKEPYGQ